MDDIAEMQGFNPEPAVNSMAVPNDDLHVPQYSNHSYMDVNPGVQDFNPGPINNGTVMADSNLDPQNFVYDQDMDMNAALPNDYNPGLSSDLMNGAHEYVDPRLLAISNPG